MEGQGGRLAALLEADVEADGDEGSSNPLASLAVFGVLAVHPSGGSDLAG